MLKLSAVLLFLSTMFLLRIFRESQGGGWEVSQRAVCAMITANRRALLCFGAAMILFFFNIKTFTQAGLLDRILFLCWCAAIVAAFLIVWRNRAPVDAFRLSESLRGRYMSFFRIGLGINLGLLVRLLWTM